MSAVQALAFTVWQRHRLPLVGIGVFLLVANLTALTIARFPHLNAVAAGISAAIVVLLFVATYLYLVGMFIHPEADVATSRSSYPAYMFTLPVKTGQLALCPLVLGSLSTFVCGFAFSVCAQASRASLGLWWPAFLGMTLMAVLQAVFWYPFGVPYLKLVLTVVSVPALAIGTTVAFSEGANEALVCAGCAVLTALCYGAAFAGVSRARRGETNDLSISRRDQSAKSNSRSSARSPFRSAAAAQLWYEWRHQGFVLPLLGGFLFLVFCVPMLFDGTLTELTSLRQPHVRLSPTVPTYFTVYVQVLLFVVPWAAWVIGAGARRTDLKRGDRTFHLFFGTRPMSDWRLVLAKIRVALLSSVGAWLLLCLLTLPILLLVKGGYIDIAEQIIPPDKKPLYQILAPYMTRHVLMEYGALAVLIVLFTCRNYLVGFWSELSGKAWLRHGYPIGLGFAVAIGLAIMTSFPESDTRASVMRMVLFASVFWVLLMLKAVATFVTIFFVRRRGLMSWRQIASVGAVYAAVVAVALPCALFYTADDREYIRDYGNAPSIFLNIIPVLVLLWVPLARIFAAPLMLSMNRHR